jgi:hypothetical protein
MPENLGEEQGLFVTACFLLALSGTAIRVGVLVPHPMRTGT